MTVKVFGIADERTRAQIERCAERAAFAVLCADNHVGYSQPIGGAVAFEDLISPSGVGYDIGCGNKAVRTPLAVADLDIAAIMDEIARRISFGLGRVNDEPVDHPVLDQIAHAAFPPQRKLVQQAANQLGTVGSGNHYVDLFADAAGLLWVGVHFGSRGFGHRTASGFLAMAAGGGFQDRVLDGEMDSPPVLLDTRGELGQAYIEAMTLAGDYAHAGRDVVVEKVLEILGTTATYAVHNHHNFAWRETHFGRAVWVVRKGCTPAFPGQEGFVGGSMGDISVILAGVEHPDSALGLYSTVHGAGRVMSRRRATGRTRRRKLFSCTAAGCIRQSAGREDPCPEHPDAHQRKSWYTDQLSPGEIDWDVVRRELRADGLELRGGGADEAPGVYKRLPDVLAAHGPTIEVRHRLTPIGVAMAGGDVHDPYKD